MEMNATTDRYGANRRVAWQLGMVVVVMFGFGFALVPLYDIICEVTGLNGKTNSSPIASAVAASGEGAATRKVNVEMIGNLPAAVGQWQFKPVVRKVEADVGTFEQVEFIATNLSDRPRAGQAVPSVVPWEAARYFEKIECFCFERQDFAPGESRAMPVVFRIDPQLADEVGTITLSYTFYEVDS